MEYINGLIEAYNIPLLSAFLLGILTAISPCPLSTNITAIAYISKDIKDSRKVFLNGLIYTLGRIISYTVLAILIYFGVSSFNIANIFQGWGDKILGPILIIISLMMFGIIKLNFKQGSKKIENVKEWLSKRGYLGSFFLGVLFALAFCPYSGVLFFGILIPLTLSSTEGLILPIIFAFATGLPVILFSILIAFFVNKLAKMYSIMEKIEKFMRYFVASVFLLAGIYYLKITFVFLFNLF